MQLLDDHANNTVASIGDVATNYMVELNNALVADEFAACIVAFAEPYCLAIPSEKHGLPDDALPCWASAAAEIGAVARRTAVVLSQFEAVGCRSR